MTKHLTKLILIITGIGFFTAFNLSYAEEGILNVSVSLQYDNAYVEFDDDASATTMLIPQDEGYFDSDIYIGQRISIMRTSGTDVRIRGILWGR